MRKDRQRSPEKEITKRMERKALNEKKQEELLRDHDYLMKEFAAFKKSIAKDTKITKGKG